MKEKEANLLVDKTYQLHGTQQIVELKNGIHNFGFFTDQDSAQNVVESQFLWRPKCCRRSLCEFGCHFPFDDVF